MRQNRALTEEGELEGNGEEEWIDGAKYVGAYKNGMKDGYGVYKWANGSIYKGNWT